MAVAVLLCASCGSHHVDVTGWRGSVASIRCASCDHEAPVSGFTVGRIWRNDEPAIVRAALEDAAMPLSAVR